MHIRDIGIAIGIPEPFSTQLQDARDRFGDTAAFAIPPHVTLLPPTPVPVDHLEDIGEHLAKVAASQLPFRITLHGTGTFRPVSPVVFVQLAAGEPQCRQLEEGVRSGPLARLLTFDYHPHVTVAHDVPDEALDRAIAEMHDYTADFPVAAFQLFERDQVGVWQPRRDFDLGG